MGAVTMYRGYTTTGARQVHFRRLAAASDASRPPLFCLHPAPSSGLYFTTVMPLLNASRTVIAPDYPGYGGSDPLDGKPSIADYAQAMQSVVDDQCPGQQVDILGFHTGCLVAAEMQLSRPEQLRRLVLCDVPYFDADVRATLHEQMAQPLPISEDLASLEPAWKFNIASRLGHVPMDRAFELFAEHLRVGRRDALGFAAAFSYDCDGRFAKLDGDIVVLGTTSGLLDATRAAAAAINNVRLIEALEITAAVFESGAEGISQHILRALDE